MFLDENPLWYKDGVIYQVHIKSYMDGNNDGIGDFPGLMSKLDYIKNLGVNIIWLLPFYPSPLKDDGYDTQDYYDVNPDYGTLDEFKEFLNEAHKKGLRVVTELVLNHTSDQCEWFQRARRAPSGSVERDFYVWSDDPNKYKDARIIFTDFEPSNWSWDPVANAYYWHRFFYHQPDLNFDNPAVHEEFFKIVDFWFGIGVDGLRLDAVPYLYEREGTNCENLPETHAFLKKLNHHIQTKFKDKMLLAEANQWPEDAVEYFGKGDECQMAFHFPVMPRLYMSIQMENRFPITDILEQTPAIPENCQWAMFLRNHDELTLEMVTDEERDFMYRSYVKDPKARINLGIRRRLAPLVENDRRKIELLNILLFSFPGTPIVYYGDEIGMGDNYYLGDRNGVRTPMQWSPDRNAGFSKANPQKLILPIIIDPEYHYEALNVEVQQRNQSSIWWWMKKAISVRTNLTPLGRGTIEFLTLDNQKVLAFIREYEDEKVLVVVNLSKSPQSGLLDLSKYVGYNLREVFSRNIFPPIKEEPFTLFLNPYDYYWFTIEKSVTQTTYDHSDLLTINVSNKLSEVLIPESRFEKVILKKYFSKILDRDVYENKLLELKLHKQIQFDERNFLLIVRTEYTDKDPLTYVLPVTIEDVKDIKNFDPEIGADVIAKVKMSDNEYFLINGFLSAQFRERFFSEFISSFNQKGNANFKIVLKNDVRREEIKPELNKMLKTKNWYYSFLLNDYYLVKFYRKIEKGIHPAEEVHKKLSEVKNYFGVTPYLGSIYYEEDRQKMLLGTITENIHSQGDAEDFFSNSMANYFEKYRSEETTDKYLKNRFLDEVNLDELKQSFNFIDTFYLEMSSKLGERVAEMHKVLYNFNDNRDFVPEEFSLLYQRSVYQSIRTELNNALRGIRRKSHFIKEISGLNIDEIFEKKEVILNSFIGLLHKKYDVKKIRIHNNLVLTNILFTGKDFVMTGFDGVNLTPLSERRIKRSAMRDLASVLWSLHKIAYTVYIKNRTDENKENLKKFIYSWWFLNANSFIRSYYECIKDEGFLPNNHEDFEYLLKVYLLFRFLSEFNDCLETEGDTTLIALLGLRNIMFL